jgi:beta-RFAP synthase
MGASEMRDSVTVSVAARLHLGFLDLNGGLGRRFGSLGLALEEPRTSLELRRAAADTTAGPQAGRARVYLEKAAAALAVPGGHALTILQAIPEHAGLGSGTQLALAVAAALRSLHGLPLDAERDASLLDRGARSGLGMAFFRQGGVVLDGGRSGPEGPVPVIARLPFPADWRILLILDRSRQGMHGDAEAAAFAALPEFPSELAAHLCRLAVMLALPALAEADIRGFGRAITEIQRHIGDYFAPAQNGRYASPAVARALAILAKRGAEGFGQSSWGPTGFAFARSADEALSWRNSLADMAAEAGLEITIVKGRNEGASIGVRRIDRRGARHG